MHTPTWTRRALAASAASALVAGSLGLVAATSASAASDRVSLISTDTTYLSDTLGLPAQTVVETVTYDRFQWLLQQPGQYAFVIGSSYDAGFSEKVVQADLAAKAAGASTIYWFDPNLTGLQGIRNLDTRNPAGINLSTASRTTYGNIWRNVLGQYLGNGIKATPNSITTVTFSTNPAENDAVVNDAVNPIWDYRTDETPAVSSTDSIFFVYDKDNTFEGAADKIVDWVNLTATDTASVSAEVQAVFTVAGGGSVIDSRSQFDWWKSSANRKHGISYSNPAQYGGDILEDADDAEGWRIQQVTYPELLHLLNKNGSDDNFVLLFGGTWCHNTRAVIKQVNHEAQEHKVEVVYNFDFVLDGGTTNGTNGGSNPIHVRDNRNSGSTNNFRPSYVYGDVFSTYFPNVVTELAGVTYYPGGDLSATVRTTTGKAQVPFLLHYERGTGANPSATAVQRQWIRDNGNGTYKEYMTEWWFTNPPAGSSGSPSGLALGAEAVAKLTEFFGALPGVTIASPTIVSPQVPYGSAAVVTLTVPDTGGHVPSGNATLSIDGTTYSGAVTDNTVSFSVVGLAAGTHAYTVSYSGDPNIQSFTRSDSVTVTKLQPTAVGSITKAPSTTASGTYHVQVLAASGLPTPTGSVTVKLTKGALTHQFVATLSSGSTTVALPKLASGNWSISVSYGGDAVYQGAASSGGLAIASPFSGASARASAPSAEVIITPAIEEDTEVLPEVDPSPSPEPTVEATQEPEASADADDTADVVTKAQEVAAESGGISTGILLLGGLVGLGFIGYVAFQLIQRGTRGV